MENNHRNIDLSGTLSYIRKSLEVLIEMGSLEPLAETLKAFRTARRLQDAHEPIEKIEQEILEALKVKNYENAVRGTNKLINEYESKILSDPYKDERDEAILFLKSLRGILVLNP